jgi:Ger(x)C family germination protein
MASNDFTRELIRDYTRFYSVFFCVGVILLTLLISLIRRQGQGGKKAARATAALLVCVLLLGSFSGCMGVREPDAEIYPIIIGYDKGVKEKYLITLKFMTEAKSGSGEDAAKEEPPGGGNALGTPGDVRAFEAPSFSDGLHLVSALLPRGVSLQHIRLLIVSEELAKEGLTELVTAIINSNLFKPTMPVVISKCSAFDFTSSKSPILASSVENETEMIMETVRESTSYLGMTLTQFFYRYNAPYGDGMAIYGDKNLGGFEEKPKPKEGEESKQETPEEPFARTPSDSEKGYVAGEIPVVGNREAELAGMAVFSGEKMTGILDTDECQILALLGKTLQDAQVLFPDPQGAEKYRVAVNLRRVQDVTITATVDDEEKAQISIQADYKGLMGVVQNPEADYIDAPAQRDALRQHCEQILTQRGEDLIKKLQSAYKSDVMQLGRHVAGNFATIEEWEQYNWREKFPEAEISIQFSIHM